MSNNLSLKDFDYILPSELIAQEPASPRDHSRLLVLDKAAGGIAHKHFYDIIDYFRPGDVLVMNNSKVFPARLIGKRKGSGGRLEVFLLRQIETPPPALPLGRGRDGAGACRWQCLIGGRRARVGLQVEFEQGLAGELKKDNGDSTWEVEFNMDYDRMMKAVEEIGQVPLPPYIRRHSVPPGLEAPSASGFDDHRTYQTVYADNGKVGSVAAPTAGLHFTPELLEKIKNKGVQIEYVTLHVGLGTFSPVKVDDITKHRMHSEWVEIAPETMARIYFAKKNIQRIITVGTTSTRSLEAMALEFPISNFQFPKNNQSSNFQTEFFKQFVGFYKNVDIFIYPGYGFKIVDAMLTNFHLPKSTLLMLVSTLAGKANIDRAYAEAIKEKYRFFSYGDAMLIIA